MHREERCVAGPLKVVLQWDEGHPPRVARLQLAWRNMEQGRNNPDRHPEIFTPHGAALQNALTRYVAGEAVQWPTLPLASDDDSPFARAVRDALGRIPSGQTATYGELAERAGSPGAARAVGSVMAGNRFPLVQPCHRVVPGSGSDIGNFSGEGPAMKRYLLTLESEGPDAAAELLDT